MNYVGIRALRMSEFGIELNNPGVDNSSKILDIINEAQANEIDTILVDGLVYTDKIVMNGVDTLRFVGEGFNPGFRSLVELKSDYSSRIYIEGLFEIDNCKNITFNNLSFDVEAEKWYPKSWLCPIYLFSKNGYSENILIEKCHFDNCGPIYSYIKGDSVLIAGKNVTIRDCDFIDRIPNLASSINLRYIDNIRVKNCNYQGKGGDHFFKSKGSHDISIENCHIEDSNDSAIYINGGPARVTGNTVRRSGKDAIKAVFNTGPEDAHSNIISNNQIFGAGRIKPDSNAGINVEGDGVLVCNNYIEAIDTSDWDGIKNAKMTGIKAANTTNCFIHGNLIYGTSREDNYRYGGMGIRISGSADRVFVKNNVISNFHSGVRVWSYYVKNIVVSSNEFINLVDPAFGNKPLSVSAQGSGNRCSGFVITNNIVHGGNEGIYVHEVNGLILKNNTIIDIQKENKAYRITDCTNITEDKEALQFHTLSQVN